MQLSGSTLMLALKAVEDVKKRYEEKLGSKDLSDEDEDYYGHYVLDLTKASAELESVYLAARRQDSALPDVNDLLKCSRPQAPSGR